MASTCENESQFNNCEVNLLAQKKSVCIYFCYINIKTSSTQNMKKRCDCLLAQFALHSGK